ncbi:MAG TPA: ACT domain-containing protein [Gemmatimonadota bacterium]|jgi:glycine cleavage system regulatory protein
MSHLVVTTTGPDRPGIVQRVTRVLVAHGGNVEEARMARLGGEFAAIMLVSAPEANLQPLQKDLVELEAENLRVVARLTTKAAEPFRGYVPYELALSGADHVGILHAVSDFLAREGINIESLDTEVTNAPVTGIALFSMRAVLQAPPSISFAELRRRLAEIADELGVDIELKFA